MTSSIEDTVKPNQKVDVNYTFIYSDEVDLLEEKAINPVPYKLDSPLYAFNYSGGDEKLDKEIIPILYKQGNIN